MPTYEYECTNCGHVTEIFQSITANHKRKPDDPCEGCGQRAPIRRLIGAGGAILFKGAGFYETDYRSEGYKKSAQAEKKKTDSSSDKDSKKKTEKKTKKSETSKKSDSTEK